MSGSAIQFTSFDPWPHLSLGVLEVYAFPVPQGGRIRMLSLQEFQFDGSIVVSLIPHKTKMPRNGKDKVQ